MEKMIRYDENAVSDALATLGLSAKILTDSLLAGYLALASSTPNDPPSAGGFNLWARTVRVLRENTLVLGWTKSDEKGFSTVVSPCGKISIAVFAGCANTGHKEFRPSTKRSRGKCTVDAVLSNQILLPLRLPNGKSVFEQEHEAERITWVLLHYVDHQRNEIRSEFSLPASIGNDGFIDKWKERIILPVQKLGSVPPLASVAPDFGQEIKIEIQKRA